MALGEEQSAWKLIYQTEERTRFFKKGVIDIIDFGGSNLRGNT